MFHTYRVSSDQRVGAVLVCVLVCMGIATTIGLVAVRSSLQVRRQLRQELQLEQTRWLLDAGIARGLQQLNRRPDYQGETWEVSPALPTDMHATIEIKVLTEPTAGPATDGQPTDQPLRRLQVKAAIGTADGLAVPAPGFTSRTDSILLPALSSSSDNG